VIRCIGDAMTFNLDTELDEPVAANTSLYLQCATPSRILTSAATVFTLYPIRVSGRHLLVDTLPGFVRAGYYDWRVVELREAEPVLWTAAGKLRQQQVCGVFLPCACYAI
jgi:hypothetical protein